MWMQLAVLSSYRLLAVRTSMRAAVHRLLAKTPWDVERTLAWVIFIARRLPQSVANTVQDLVVWRSANWHNSWYASWHIRHEGPCGDYCADWSYDLPIILSISPFPLRAASGGLGSPPGEGGYR